MEVRTIVPVRIIRRYDFIDIAKNILKVVSGKMIQNS
jgi:hypothetical protein